MAIKRLLLSSILLFFIAINIYAQTRHSPAAVNFEIRGLCPNDSTYFINKTVMGSDYSWLIFDNKNDTIYKSNENDISFSFDKVGTYTIFLQSDNGHISNKTKKVIVDTVPHADFEFWTCYNEFVNYSTCADQYSWTLPDGTTSTDISPKYNFTKAGPYTVTLTAKKGTKTDILTKTGIIYLDSMHLPSSDFNYFLNPKDSKNLLYIANDTTANNYHWVFLEEGVYDDTGYKIIHPITADTMTIYLAVTNGCGFNNSIQQVILTHSEIKESGLKKKYSYLPKSNLG